MKALAKNIFVTSESKASVILRVILGSVLFAHSARNRISWFGNSAGKGYEYPILVIGICSALFVLGDSAWSLDRKLASRITR